MKRIGKRKRNLEQRRRRRVATRTPLPRLLVVCEGEVTERRYIEEFCREFREAAVVEVQIDKTTGVPKTLVERAAKVAQRANREARRRRDSFLSFDEVWCMFDVDDHPKLAEALEQARANHISTAVSNPCVELWALFHFQEQVTGITTKAVQTKLRSYLPDYKKVLPFDTLLPHLPEALTRAERQSRRMAEQGEARGNPSTGVPGLLRRIRGEQ